MNIAEVAAQLANIARNVRVMQQAGEGLEDRIYRNAIAQGLGIAAATAVPILALHVAVIDKNADTTTSVLIASAATIYGFFVQLRVQCRWQ